MCGFKKEEEKRNLKEKKKEEEVILEEWKQKWYDNGGDEFFEKTFCSKYQEIVWKKRKNKFVNFVFKPLFLLFFILLVLSFFENWKNVKIVMQGIENFVAGNVDIFLAIIFVVGTFLGKFLGIKKYQETWVRHSRQQQKLDIEMLKFLENADGYGEIVSGDYESQCGLFINNTLKIWEGNVDIFVENMKKEEGLLDVFDVLKRVKK